MPVRLISLNTKVPGRDVVLDHFPAVLGRSSEADVSLTDSWISRRHCEIDCVDKTLRIRDLGSCNGTLLNGSPLREAHLRPGDRLTIGLSIFEVQYEPTGTGFAQPDRTRRQPAHHLLSETVEFGP